MTQLTLAVECKLPTDDEINSVFKAVEAEFIGRPFNGENIVAFKDEVKSRVLAMVAVVVTNTTQPRIVGVDGVMNNDHYFS